MERICVSMVVMVTRTPNSVTLHEHAYLRFRLIKSAVCGHRVSQFRVFGIRNGHTSAFPSTGLKTSYA